MEETIMEKIADQHFHGVDYILRISAKEDQLSVELEQKNTGDIWKNHFSANYIEEITQKTGNYKKYGVFLKMLFSSLNKSSDTVYLDVLTVQDLLMLKNKKQGDQSNNNAHNKTNSGQNSPLNSSGVMRQKNMKRYMILSYVVEYDKVHYPLPLNFEEEPSADTLRNTMRRFRLEIDELRSKGGNFLSSNGNGQGVDGNQVALNLLRNENETLRNKFKRLEEASTQRTGAVEVEQIYKKNVELESTLETVRAQHKREVIRLQQQADEFEKELLDKKTELHQLKCEYASMLDNDEGSKNLQSQILKQNEKHESELTLTKKTLIRQSRELDNVTGELEQLRLQDKKQKIRIKQLECDLENAMKKTSYRGVTDRLYAGGSRASSRGSSPAHSTYKRSISVPQKNIFTPQQNKFNSRNNSRNSSRAPSVSNTPTNKGLYGSGSGGANKRVSNNTSKPTYATPMQANKTQTTYNVAKKTPNMQNRLYNQSTPKSSSAGSNMYRPKQQHSSSIGNLNAPAAQNQNQNSRAYGGVGAIQSKIQQNQSRTNTNANSNKLTGPQLSTSGSKYNQQRSSGYGNYQKQGQNQNSSSKYAYNNQYSNNSAKKLNQIGSKYGLTLKQQISQSPVQKHAFETGGIDDEQQGLLRKLEELKNKNKENQVGVKVSTTHNNDSKDIDDRLNKLSNLLKQAKC